MTSLKKIFLPILFLSQIHSGLLAEEQAQQTWPNWVKSFFVAPTEKSHFTKAIEDSIATGAPLDLLTFYNAKELKDESSSFNDPAKAAEKFKNAVETAAKTNSIMARFKDNPTKFFWGASSSDYQFNGDSNHPDTNANAVFYKQKGFKTAGKGIDFFKKYKNDIKQMKDELGINSFRLSIGWDRVQPGIRGWDREAINTYVDIIRTLKEYGIEPIIVLHHYTIPQWFAEIGGFENAENNKHFVRFAAEMYKALHKDVTYWSTFNAIEGYAFKGYYKLDGPPGITKSLFTTEKVMYNMLNAHAQVYEAFKGSRGILFDSTGLYQQYRAADPSIPNPQIGIQKNIVLFDPFQNKDGGFCEKKGSQFICSFSSLLNNTIFFKVMRYKYSNKLDWIGVNIYSNMFMLGTQPQRETEENRKTENLNYRDYPEGIYRAVKIINDSIAKPLNIPIIITENGIATTNTVEGNAKRTRFFKRALYTIRKLIEEGYPIIGYTPWASHDNYEWPSKDQPNPYDRPYGLFHVDFNSPDLTRTLKKGAEFYRNFVKTYLSKENRQKS